METITAPATESPVSPSSTPASSARRLRRGVGHWTVGPVSGGGAGCGMAAGENRVCTSRSGQSGRAGIECFSKVSLLSSKVYKREQKSNKLVTR